MKQTHKILVVALLLFVIGIIFYSIYYKYARESSTINSNNRIMVSDQNGNLLHLDCTKQINCGYCKRAGLDCPKKTL